MFPVVAAVGLVAAVTVGPPWTAAVELSHASLHVSPERVRHLPTVALSAPLLEGSAWEGRERPHPPACLGDVCQPRVSVPGFEPHYGRAHRTELVVLALERARLEPFASIGWALVATGIRVDYTPPVLDGPNTVGHGWGSVFMRLRLRIDADNVPVFPRRPGRGDQRPARLSRT